MSVDVHVLDVPFVKVDAITSKAKYSCVGGPFGSSLSRVHYVEEEAVPVIRGTNLVGDQFVDDGFVFVSESKADALFRNLAYPGDIVFTQRGTLGQVAIIPTNARFKRYVVSQSQMKLTVNDAVADAYYVYTYFRSSEAKKAIENSAIIGGVPHINLGILKSMEIPLPSLQSQKAISRITKCLDEKIQLNRQTNQTLEQIAQAIFRSWFVDFEPTRAKIAAREHWLALHEVVETSSPTCYSAEFDNANHPAQTLEEAMTQAAMAAISGKSPKELEQLSPEQQQNLRSIAALFSDTLVDSELGEIPEGWGLSKLGNILEFNPKRVLKKGVLAPYLDMKNVPTQGHLADEVVMREMASGTKFINGDTLLARITPCLENGKTAFVDFLEDEQVAWGSTEYIVIRPKGNRPVSLGYILARQESFRSKAIQSMTGTSGRQRAEAKALAECLWVDYPIHLLMSFDAIAGSYLAKAKINGDQNKVLEELRDTLLPKLLSGELSPASTKEDAEVPC